jgi:hypoxanthine phosphoribosyltransferase
MIKIKDKFFQPYIGSGDLLEKVSLLAKKIEDDYKHTDPVLLAVLNGSFMFMSDLSKAINIPVEVSFVKVASYQSTQSSGQISDLIGLEMDLEGRDVIIIEDIVDTGRSMAHILKKIVSQNPNTVEIASLLLKPAALKEKIRIKYLGFEIPDLFVVGYGLDYMGFGRNLNQIYQIAE